MSPNSGNTTNFCYVNISGNANNNNASNSYSVSSSSTIVIKSDAGTGPNDLVAVVLSDKLHRKFSIVRIITDILFILSGFLLGGAVGIGTIICACLVGPVAGIFLPIQDKWIHKIICIATKKQ